MSSSAELCTVTSNRIEEVWEDILPWVRMFLPYCDGKYTEKSIKQSLKEKDMQLWVMVNKAIDGIAITQISNYPGKKVCTVMFCAGVRMHEWINFIEHIEDWAESEGCESVEIYGRPGWEKVLGWGKVHTVLRKNL